MESPSAPLIQIGHWQLNPQTGLLCQGIEQTRLDERTLRILLCLIDHAGQVVSSDVLLQAGWPEVVVSQDSVYQAVSGLRRQLRDTAREPQFIATVPRLGYRWLAEVRRVPVAQTPPAMPAPSPEPGLPAGADLAVASGIERPGWPRSGHLPGRMGWWARLILAGGLVAAGLGFGLAQRQPAAAANALAVLPFADLTDQMKREPFADGVTEELIQVLGQLPGAQVRSRTDSFALKGDGRPAAQLAEVLQVHWLVEGSVRQSGDTLRVTVRLIEAPTGTQRWAQDLEQPASNTLQIQDEVARVVRLALQQRHWPS